ncbi:hypothetical protein QK916_12985 [Lactococcus lactis]|jgi:hypothetical protein|uniref:Uncharacterized protein n=1 Tax=Lactococcus lactis subsp. lactis TaxID=1360 RepID=A0A1V0NYS2_LACLL|nr:hypothetical protein [Lactococcus lactis]ARE19548.1 hypothetical protein LLUC06_04130 [Lactococcus lactis subsp. lactis]ESK78376.1 hypothetical protein T211_11895 [Lactococcus lactis subsp. lactis bv. diacetylactis str. LD61]MUV48116.1 hypothetical protein [Lactococcus lactis]NRD18325.1 hypothetical protein [Lactococcus lactis subsp. lactis]
MARKGLLERKVEGAISPTQKFESDASINIVKPEKKQKNQFKNQKVTLKISDEIKTSLEAIKVLHKLKFDYEAIQFLIDDFTQNLSADEKRRYSVLKDNL